MWKLSGFGEQKIGEKKICSAQGDFLQTQLRDQRTWQ